LSVRDQPIPYGALEAIFLDVGNTLVSIDFDWIAAELAQRDTRCDAQQLRRAEAAARPWVSAQVAEPGSEARIDFSFERYLEGVLTCLAKQGVELGRDLNILVGELVPILKPDGLTARLWSWVLPGVPDALEAFRSAGLKLAVVSNADGTVEAGLRAQGLHGYFDAVLDSHVVGADKPDARIFEAALAQVSANPASVLHVGDLYSADVVGARGAGLHALLLDPFDDWPNVDCHWLPDLTALAQRISEARSEA
jgi:HAD superfamily hydrolase (TIGR01509 family)